MPMRRGSLSVLLLGALVLTSLAGAMARPDGVTPAPPSQAADPKQPSQEREEEPRVVRWVCTDHLCGGCDGACSRSGHVAVSRKGHCACTPTPGGRLDTAIRKAFEPHVRGR